MHKKICISLVFVLICCLIYAQKNNDRYFTLPDGASENDYLQKTIIIKIKDKYRDKCNTKSINIYELEKLVDLLKFEKLSKIFPKQEKPSSEKNSFGEKYADLSLIYEIFYKSNYSVSDAVNMAYNTGIVEYAQPHYILNLLYIPNDPKANPTDTSDYTNYQYYLKTINAFNAWDITKGDTNVVIGITDTGTNLNATELQDKIKYNYNDPIDSIDNDNDGYLDNYYGWNFINNNNNPEIGANGHGHGIHVAGIAAAETDNNIGIAGVGFNCKYLPVKITDINDVVIYGYESIVYAAEHGCQIINCSWGGRFNTGEFGQDVITYATINKNCLVVVSCGNENNERDYYPASYKYAFSVAATNKNNNKWTDQLPQTNGSCYGINVDISAPGQKIYSTFTNNSFISSSGTSMASPIVSGCAALVKSHFPNLTGIQIGELLRVTSDNIDNVPGNQPYAGKLGKGRVNIYKALTTTTPAIRFSECNYSENYYNNKKSGDTILISGKFTNYLYQATNLSIKIVSLSTDIKPIDSIINLGNIGDFNMFNNNNHPFKLKIKSSVKNNAIVVLKLIYIATNYSDYQYIRLNINSDNVFFDNGKIKATFTSDGRIGYSNYNPQQGYGLSYIEDKTILFCGGLLIGNSFTNVSDNIYGALGSYDNDFKVLNPAKFVQNPQLSDIEIKGSFSDSLAGSNKLNILIKYNIYGFTTEQDKDFLILKYNLKNIGNQPINVLYAGLFMDWDISPSEYNLANYDKIANFSYVFPSKSGIYAGTKLLSDGLSKHYAFDNDGKSGSLNIAYNQSNSSFYDGFTTSEKYESLKSKRDSAGYYGGNDVSEITSTGPFDIMPKDSIIIAYAIVLGSNFGEIKENAAKAQEKYLHLSINQYDIIDDDMRLFIFPNPASNNLNISYYLTANQNINIQVFEYNGKLISETKNINSLKGNNNLNISTLQLKNGLYFLKLISKNKTSIIKFLINK